jgi:hypothetical protein
MCWGGVGAYFEYILIKLINTLMVLIDKLSKRKVYLYLRNEGTH